MRLPSREELIEQCWRDGDLTFALSSPQRDVARFIEQSTAKWVALNLTRRFGKSTLVVNMATSMGLRKKHALMRYAAPTAKMVHTIVVPLMRKLHETAPDDLKPRFYKQDGIWVWPTTKAELHASGCDGDHADRLRGSDADLWIVDEARDVSNLRYVVQSILMPQTLTTNGRGIMTSTPPTSPSHEFVAMCIEAQAHGAYARRTIYDVKHIPPRVVNQFRDESGGEESTTWKREYLAQFIVDENMALVPEFQRNKEHLVGKIEHAQYFDPWVSVDFGYSDMTFAVFGYWNFDEARLDIVKEAVFQHSSSSPIVEECKRIERELWVDRQPRRVADAPQLLLADLIREHKYSVAPAKKDDRDASLNALRNACKDRKLRIDEGCVRLIAHMEHGIWNTNRTQFARSGEFGHFDGVAALMYMWRHVDKQKNPNPVYAPGVTLESHWVRPVRDKNVDLRPPWRR